MKKEGKNTKTEKGLKMCPKCNGGKKKRMNTKTGQIIPCPTCRGKEVI